MNPHRLSACVFAFLCAASAADAADGPDALVRRLGDASFEQREDAFRSLLQLGPQAEAALRRAAASADPEIRQRARAALRMIRWGVTPELAAKTGDAFKGYEQKRWFERERLVMTVAAVGGAAALPCLERVLIAGKSIAARRAAAAGLLRLGPEGLLAADRSGADVLKLPGGSELRLRIGNAFLEEKKPKRAVEQYRKGLETAPTHAMLWYNLGCAYAQLKRYPDALAALRKAIAFGYDHVDWLRKDPDLDGLRANDAFKRLIEDLEKKGRKN